MNMRTKSAVRAGQTWTDSERGQVRVLAAAVAEMNGRHGIELAPMPGNAFPDRARRRAAVLRRHSVPVREIARRISVSRGAVSNWTREARCAVQSGLALGEAD